MFDIGFAELLLIAIIGLIVLGPERLPHAIRTVTLWVGRIRRGFTAMKSEIEREVGADEIKRQLHNERIMDELKQAQKSLQENVEDVKHDLDNSIHPALSQSSSSQQPVADSKAPPTIKPYSVSQPASDTGNKSEVPAEKSVHQSDS
ncbi:Sec-independent protein translocase protein TatB [Zooshikella harenae]|uniref:Sec-independent protein translocase protein TatB n=1 Tax=Zooshikella harenae TaxID=2827238 RepID=A0ABS5Z6C0_9GAMM|nr:Sec-independent protein translocase protein TatB [Zooshikella harenae]MBU2709596.1 twin-arginine translocase subunit TatB [Zooshikella harenae]